VPVVDPNAETDSNHDTALTLACAGGHAELVKLLLSHNAEIEHRDKKGERRPLITPSLQYSESSANPVLMFPRSPTVRPAFY